MTFLVHHIQATPAITYDDMWSHKLGVIPS